MKRTAHTNFQFSPPPSHNLCRRLRHTSPLTRLPPQQTIFPGSTPSDPLFCLRAGFPLADDTDAHTAGIRKQRIALRRLHPKTPKIIADRLSSPDKYAFCAANSLPASDKYKFGATNFLSALDKHEFGATNSLPALDKHEFGATNSFSAVNKYKFGAQDSLPALDKYEFGATNSLSAVNKYEFDAQDESAGFPARTPTHPETIAAYAAAEQYGKGAFL